MSQHSIARSFGKVYETNVTLSIVYTYKLIFIYRAYRVCFVSSGAHSGSPKKAIIISYRKESKSSTEITDTCLAGYFRRHHRSLSLSLPGNIYKPQKRPLLKKRKKERDSSNPFLKKFQSLSLSLIFFRRPILHHRPSPGFRFFYIQV